MTDRKPLTTSLNGFRFVWHGGEYIDISGPGTGGAFEVINTTRADGTLPEFTVANFHAELEDVDFAELRASAREAARYRPAGTS